MNAMLGTKSSARERSGFGLMPTFKSIQRQRSCSATMWQAQPQKKRPKIAVSTVAARKKRAGSGLRSGPCPVLRTIAASVRSPPLAKRDAESGRDESTRIALTAAAMR